MLQGEGAPWRRGIGTTGVHVSVVGLGGYEFEETPGWTNERSPFAVL